VEFTTSAYATYQYERQFYEWAAVNFPESSHEHLYVYVRYYFPFRLHRDTWEDLAQLLDIMINNGTIPRN